MLCGCCMRLHYQGRLSPLFLSTIPVLALNTCTDFQLQGVLAYGLPSQSYRLLLFSSQHEIILSRSALHHSPTLRSPILIFPRFITGLADTQIDLTRDKPSWFPPGKSLLLPLPLLEIRHRIVHRHLPSLAELKRAAQDSLDWLWEWYWSQLDHAFGLTNKDEVVEGVAAVREKLQGVLKTYLKERKSEIKAKKRDGRAAEVAVSTYNLRFASRSTSTPSNRVQAQLLQLLVSEKTILPADKKLGSSMSGAFMIWTPLLLAFSTASPSVLSTSELLDPLFEAMNTSAVSRAMVDLELDPVREGMSEWILHIISSMEWQTARSRASPKIVEDTLIRCFSEPTFWNLRIADKLLRTDDVSNQTHWQAILDAARNEDAMELDHATDPSAEGTQIDMDAINEGMPVVKTDKEKIKGPRKVIGLWKPMPIGWLPDGFEEDE
jgi:ribosomal biogenesis protein LAS1